MTEMIGTRIRETGFASRINTLESFDLDEFLGLILPMDNIKIRCILAQCVCVCVCVCVSVSVSVCVCVSVCLC